jgi:hypothetical protein
MGEANPPRNNSASRDAVMIDMNFIVYLPVEMYFSGIAGQAFSSPNQFSFSPSEC